LADTRSGFELDRWEVRMHCQTCQKGALVEIRMVIGDAPVTFRRCGRCEAQSWETPDGRVPLVTVLELARRR
jgi:hypothetical protein